MEDKEEKKKIRYEVFSVRLHEGTKKLLVERQKKSGLSWNRYIYQLLKSKE